MDGNVLSWLFKRQAPEPLTPTQLRDRLIDTAASGSSRKLRVVCRQYKEQVAANLDVLRKPPEELKNDPVALDRYVQCLGAVAHCLAFQCDAPDLWNKLSGTPADNPLLKWDRWCEQVRERMGRLEYDALIAEARGFVEQVRTFQGSAARQREAVLNGRLGELLFHSGLVSEAESPFRRALQGCRDTGDAEGQQVYLNNLLEVHRHIGNTAEAVCMGEELVSLMDSQGVDSTALWNLSTSPISKHGCYALLPDNFRQTRPNAMSSSVAPYLSTEASLRGPLPHFCVFGDRGAMGIRRSRTSRSARPTRLSYGPPSQTWSLSAWD